MKLAGILVGTTTLFAANPSWAQIKTEAAATELLLKPFLAELLKSDFNSMFFCGLVAIRDKSTTPILKVNGFGITCAFDVQGKPKIWFSQIGPDGTYIQAHFLDQTIKKLQYAYGNGNILAVADSNIPTYVMFDAQGKTVWQYQTGTTENIALENIADVEMEDGYIITYYSPLAAGQTSGAGEGNKLLTVHMEKIDRQGKSLWKNNLELPVPENIVLSHENSQAVQIWALQNNKFAISIQVNRLDEKGEVQIVAYMTYFYNEIGIWESQYSFHTEGIGAEAEKIFAIQQNGQILFLFLNGKEDLEKWQLPYQWEFKTLTSDGKLKWKQHLMPALPPNPSSVSNAVCLLWSFLIDPSDNYVVLCQPRYSNAEGWVTDTNYSRLTAYRFNKEGKPLSITALTGQKDLSEDLFSDDRDPPDNSFSMNGVFMQGKLLIAITKPMEPVTKDQLKKLMTAGNSLLISEKLGIKIYQISLPVQ